MSSSTAIFACSDIEATLAYYKDVLGFESTWSWGEPASFGGASVEGISIMFNLQPELAARIRGHEHWISVDDPDDFYRRHVDRRANVVSPIADRPWGFREYVVEDLNGYRLRFAGPLSGSRGKSQPLPEGLTIERRKPTWEEYFATADDAGYKAPVAGVFESTWGGVVARSPSGETVGTLRIMRDAPRWFSIWDVAVAPAWQARGIGSAIMREALAAIREACPGATVHLFTTKHGFYERLGFAKEIVSLRQV
ncbi:MAG TPA: GNAT family N-acetyltransferase [Fimbriimonadaceae bacterium]|nr:GNAT family N-acetyltransferase [Fimbriimonadaceae bacterium]